MNFLRIALPVNRPIRKQRKPNEARFEAALLLKPSAPFRCVSNQPAKNPEAGASGGCHEVGHRRHLRRHVVDEEAEDSGLRGDVKELREHRHPKMRMRPDRLSRVRRGFIDVVVIFHLDVGHGREEKDNRENDHDHADEGVRNPERSLPVLMPAAFFE